MGCIMILRNTDIEELSKKVNGSNLDDDSKRELSLILKSLIDRDFSFHNQATDFDGNIVWTGINFYPNTGA